MYDTKVTKNLELGAERDKFNSWMEFLMGKPSPEAKAKGDGSHASKGLNGLNPPQSTKQKSAAA